MAARKKTPTQKNDVNAILAQRQKTHGSFNTHAELSMGMKTLCREHATHDIPNYNKLRPQHQEALDMILHKVARILNGNPDEHDHWDDIAGYATLASKACPDKE